MTRDHDEFGGTRALERDRTSALDGEDRRSVYPHHPYRGQREALIARRSALGRQLEEAERAALRRETIASELESVERELEAGAQMEALFEGETPCVRMRRRPDGRVIGPLSASARALRIVAAGVLFGASAGATAALASLPVLGGARVAYVEPLPVFETPAEPAAEADVRALDDEPETTMGTPVIDPPPPPSPISDEELARHIRWIAPQAWEIDRALVDRVIEVGARTMRSSSRLIPHERDGHLVGIRVFGVRQGSLLARLGVQNGDTLVDVNGRAFAEPNGLLAPALLEADAFFVRIERRGEERVHVYRIAR